MIPAFPIYLLRHGQTESNRDDKRQGRDDSPLTEKGLKQAAAMGRTLADVLDHPEDWQFLSSPILRAWRTAGIVGAACGLQPVADERLKEIGMGSWEGKTWPEIDALGPRDTVSKYPQFHVPNGERFEDTLVRGRGWLESIDRPTIAVSHGLFGLVLRATYLGLDEAGLATLPTPRQDVIFSLKDGTISEIECGE